jgi:pilus assembly protein CpaD
MTNPNRLSRPVALLAAMAALAPALAGCNSRTADATGSLYPSDFRDRHPIVLGHAPRVLDVFVEGSSGFSERERADVAAFLAEYRRSGNGPIVAQVPTGTKLGGATRTALGRLQAAAGGRMAVSSYVPEDPSIASPIRLSFHRLQARVASTCGLWPQDMGVEDYQFNEANKPYWNLGCASQSNFAAQIADPVDLVRGRQPTPPDTGRRMQNIEKLRQGQDPSTTYKADGTSVKSGVGQ